MTNAISVRAGVLTVSDAAARGDRLDESGDLAVRRLRDLGAEVVSRQVCADEPPAIRAAVVAATAAVELLVCTGGTGLGPRDRTPQTLHPLLDVEVPGMAEAMRATGRASTPHAMLSRQLVGIRGRCLVLALPGSPRAVAEGLDAIWEALPHALRLIAGGRDDHHAVGPLPARGSA